MKLIKDGNSNVVEIPGVIKKITDRGGVLFSDGDNDYWLSYSQIQNHSSEIEEGAKIYLIIPECVAFEKGLI